jgi:hypothetical protein
VTCSKRGNGLTVRPRLVPATLHSLNMASCNKTYRPYHYMSIYHPHRRALHHSMDRAAGNFESHV